MDIFLNNQEDIVLGDHFFCILVNNQEESTLSIKREIEASYIQFHFLLQGKADFLFNNGTYKLNIEEAKYLMLYNPCLLYTSPSPRDQRGSRMPSSA